MTLVSQPAANAIHAATSNGSGAGASNARLAITTSMHRMATLFQHLHACPQLVGERLPSVWAFAQQVVAALPGDTAVTESALRVIMCALLWALACTVDVSCDRVSCCLRLPIARVCDR